MQSYGPELQKQNDSFHQGAEFIYYGQALENLINSHAAPEKRDAQLRLMFDLKPLFESGENGSVYEGFRRYLRKNTKDKDNLNANSLDRITQALNQDLEPGLDDSSPSKNQRLTFRQLHHGCWKVNHFQAYPK